MVRQATLSRPVFEALEPRVLLSAQPAGVLGADLQELVSGNNAFVWDLYQQIRGQEGSLLFSPLSISAALAMTYAGARGATAEQMADVLHFTLGQDGLHGAFGELIERLQSSGEEVGSSPFWPGDPGDPLTLNIVNSLWGQQGYAFVQEFLEVLADEYGAPLERLDFWSDPEGGRQVINQWVSDQTHELIPDLLPAGAIDIWTRLVLVNALYFHASWEYSFEEQATAPQAFHLDGDDVAVEMMHQTRYFNYAQGDGYQAIELPYANGPISMVIVLPEEGTFEAFEQSLSAETMDAILGDMSHQRVNLHLPKWEFEQGFNLADTLTDMGMPDAFDQRLADFSGMEDPREPLNIGQVVHKAKIIVDETGTEAAAATAVIMVTTGLFPPPTVPFIADRPFIYTIRDTETNTTLFVGRVSDASALLQTEAEPRAPWRPPFPPSQPGPEPSPEPLAPLPALSVAPSGGPVSSLPAKAALSPTPVVVLESAEPVELSLDDAFSIAGTQFERPSAAMEAAAAQLRTPETGQSGWRSDAAAVEGSVAGPSLASVLDVLELEELGLAVWG